MRKIKLFFNTFKIVLLIVFLMLSLNLVKKKTDNSDDKIVLVEAEDFTKEENGNLQIFEGRTATSNDKCIAYWDYEGHAVEWIAKVNKAGNYKFLMRYAQGREANALRELTIDNKTLNPTFKKIILPPTGGFSKGEDNWSNFVLSDNDGKEVIFKLRRGKHKVRLNNLGSDVKGVKGSVNLDLIALLPEDVDKDAFIKKTFPKEEKFIAPKQGEISTLKLKAFPGAEGFGSSTTHGRGGTVIEVTNLNESGPGSLAEACSTKGKRIIVFKVGGIIKLKNPIYITQPFCYIAGQTAPGDGICLRGAGLVVQTHDVVIRFMRSRAGDDPDGFNPDNRDSMGVTWNNAYNVIFDHCSVSWAIDENFETWYKVYNITFQWCIIAEGLFKSLHPKGIHSMGILVGNDATNVSVHHNLFAHNNQRHPLLKAGAYADIVNNVMYNWGEKATDTSDVEKTKAPIFANVVGNFYKKGKDSKSKEFLISLLNSEYGIVPESKFFVKGNIGPSRTSDKQDDWDICNNKKEEKIFRSSKPLSAEPVTTFSAKDAYEKVLKLAGARVPVLDPVDTRILNDVVNGTGKIISKVSETPGYPEYKSEKPPVDSDHDGMPDEWEKENKLNPKDPSDGPQDRNSDGYTNVEEYLNSLVSKFIM